MKYAWSISILSVLSLCFGTLLFFSPDSSLKTVAMIPMIPAVMLAAFGYYSSTPFVWITFALGWLCIPGIAYLVFRRFALAKAIYAHVAIAGTAILLLYASWYATVRLGGHITFKTVIHIDRGGLGGVPYRKMVVNIDCWNPIELLSPIASFEGNIFHLDKSVPLE